MTRQIRSMGGARWIRVQHGYYDARLLVWHHRLVAHAAGLSLARLASLSLRWFCRLLVGLLLSALAGGLCLLLA